MVGFPKKRVSAFTLVEIVMAIGIFTFALIGVVMLLGNALRSSSETQRDSALATALGTSASVVRSMSTSVSSTNLFFNQQGSLLTNNSQAYFQFALSAKGAGTGPVSLDYWTVKVTAPYPATNNVANFVLSRMKE